MAFLPEMDLLKIETVKKDAANASFIIEPLLPGYGITLGNTLRRILLSSLPGAAVHAIKVNDITHEFSPIPGVKEDMIELVLNLKSLRLKLNQIEPVTIKLDKKGPGEVQAKDFAKQASVEIVDPNHYLASLDKSGHLLVEAIVNQGRGYVPTERKKEEKLPVGWIMVDSIYSPVRNVNFTVQNTRVGQQTDYNKLILDVSTDGTIDPEEALKAAAGIAVEHFTFIESGAVVGQKVVQPAGPVADSSTEAIEPIEELKEDQSTLTPRARPTKKKKAA